MAGQVWGCSDIERATTNHTQHTLSRTPPRHASVALFSFFPNVKVIGSLTSSLSFFFLLLLLLLIIHGLSEVSPRGTERNLTSKRNKERPEGEDRRG